MSRIGRLPVVVPSDVTVDIDGNNLVTVKGPKGTLTQQINKCIEIKKENDQIIFTRKSEENNVKAMHGLYRTLVNNMVNGVKHGYKKSLTVKGVGFKVAKQGNKLVMNIGFSHPVEVAEVEGIHLSCPSVTEIVVEGADKDLVGEMAAKIRAKRPVEPYHGYGIRYSTEVIKLKEGKTAGKK